MSHASHRVRATTDVEDPDATVATGDGKDVALALSLADAGRPGECLDTGLASVDVTHTLDVDLTARDDARTTLARKEGGRG
jgi:hypothetical protein